MAVVARVESVHVPGPVPGPESDRCPHGSHSGTGAGTGTGPGSLRLTTAIRPVFTQLKLGNGNVAADHCHHGGSSAVIDLLSRARYVNRDMRHIAQSELNALAPLLSDFQRAEVVVVGDFVADEYLYGETERISREAPVLIVRYERSELRAGCAGNAAQNLAALGVRVRAVGVVGDDLLGQALLDELEENEVDVSGIQRVKGRQTEAKTRILAGGRSTRRQQMLRVDRAPEPIPPMVADKLVKALGRVGRRAGAVLASDYGSGVLHPATIDALRRLKRGGVPVCADSRYNLCAFTGLTLLKPNEPELEVASGVSLSGPGAVERAARTLMKRAGCEGLLVTRGRNGMSLFRRGSAPVHLAPFGQKDAVDVTGAGDTVGATICAALAAGADALAAARLANVAGGLVVQKLGTATVSREELLRELLRS